jgi:hypothetical protein
MLCNEINLIRERFNEIILEIESVLLMALKKCLFVQKKGRFLLTKSQDSFNHSGASEREEKNIEKKLRIVYLSGLRELSLVS